MSTDIEYDKTRQEFRLPCANNQTARLKIRRADADTMDFYSTFVPTECRGSGLGADLVIHGLKWAQQQNLQVIPSCPFVGKVVADHPEFKPVLTKQ